MADEPDKIFQPKDASQGGCGCLIIVLLMLGAVWAFAYFTGQLSGYPPPPGR
jgi:hypothetical protein